MVLYSLHKRPTVYSPAVLQLSYDKEVVCYLFVSFFMSGLKEKHIVSTSYRPTGISQSAVSLPGS
jgi:hypothetical protein